MTMWRRTRLLSVLLVLPAIGCASDGDDGSPYPDVEVTGTLVDIRGGPIAGATVTISNKYDSAAAQTDASGGFALTVDGSDVPSSLTIRHDRYRPRDSSADVMGMTVDVGEWLAVSVEEILFTTYGAGGDIYMLRADGTAELRQISMTPEYVEASPRRSVSGLHMVWLDETQGAIYHSWWDGYDAQARYAAPAGYQLTGLDWAHRGLFVSIRDMNTDEVGITIADDPTGVTFDYQWDGQYPDLSPPTFGFVGPEAIEGNMLCFAGTHEGDAGLFTAFPYFSNAFLVPAWIAGTQAQDLYPRWSSHRSDNSLDIAFQRNYGLYVSHVTADSQDNHYSTPVQIYGDGPDDVNVNRFAWAPSIPGEPDRIALVVNVLSSGSTFADPGDIVVIEYDHENDVVVGEPTLLYDADAPGNPGMALTIDWR